MPQPRNLSHRSGGRFSNPRAEREESLVDYQVELEDVIRALLRLHRLDAAAAATDAAGDAARFRHYQDLEHAIRHQERDAQLRAFHLLVAVIEADEAAEDRARFRRIGDLHALASKLTELRQTFRTFVPGLAVGGAA